MKEKKHTHTKSDVYGNICSQNCQNYCFIILDIFLALIRGNKGI